MKPIVTIIALLPSLALAQPLPLPKPNGAPAAPCPHGYTSSGSFCVPRKGAQEAIPLPPNGTCPHSWTRSISYCLRSGDSKKGGDSLGREVAAAAGIRHRRALEAPP